MCTLGRPAAGRWVSELRRQVRVDFQRRILA